MPSTLLKALEILGIQADTNGAYVRFPCPAKCETPAAIIMTYGDKKNLWYCPKCKTGGNLLKLTMGPEVSVIRHQ